MAAGTVPAPFPGLKTRDCGMSSATSIDFARVFCFPDPQKLKSQRAKVPAIRNSVSRSDAVEMQSASKGSPLLVPRQKYCESLHKTVRRKAHTVMVGNVALGSEHPIRVQTMTTSDTKNVAKTVEEVMRIADKGADLVHITIQERKEADACFEIKNSLVRKSYNIPLVAGIHFAPSVALRVAECFDKIRVNPADRRAQFQRIEYTEEDYHKELEHIEQDGLGDTVRVSLTEPPEKEIDPCRRLANFGMQAASVQKGVVPFEEKHRHYFDFQRRSGQLPVQEQGEEVDYRGVLHRDGFVLMSVSLDQLKDLATVDSILLRELPSVEDVDARLALERLNDISMGVLTPLSEQLTKPLPHAIALVDLTELSTGAYKLLPHGT